MKHARERLTRPSWRAGRAKKRWRGANGLSIAERTELGGWVMAAAVVAIFAAMFVKEVLL